MKAKQQYLLAASFIFFSLLFMGCVKDKVTRTYSYTWFEPLYKTSDEVRQKIRSDEPVGISAPGKLFIKGNYIFLNEINKGVHIIDNSIPSSPVNKAFINIPGNVDIAVKGNTLYADLYTDLLTIDISDPLNIAVKKIIDNVFPSRYYDGGFIADSSEIIYSWVRHDTTVTEDYNGSGPIAYNGGVLVRADVLNSSAAYSGGSPVGIAGSMARFALTGNYLYTVGPYSLESIDVSIPENPVVVKSTNLNWGIETIYPFKNNLFIGSSFGMYIYDISQPGNPELKGTFLHARVCDPVIADGDYAYITLRNGNQCAGFINELDIVDIKNLEAPVLVKKYDMTNPHGLSKDGDLLFICDGVDGLRVLNAKDVNDVKQITQITGLETYDVIAYGGVAIVVAKDGLYQYDYTNTQNIQQLSKLPLSK
jgi:hypothetical protein